MLEAVSFKKRIAFLIAVSFITFGCTMNLSQKSELLTLSHSSEEIIDFANQETNTIYDPLSLLKRGEAFRVKEDYSAAGAEYSRFLELHPAHRMAAFAQYSLAESFASEVDTTDRDPMSAQQALYAFNQVLEKYPDSIYVNDSRKKIQALILHQMEHQFRIGHFYYQKGAFPAAIARFEALLKEAKPGEVTEKTLYYLSLSHHQRGNREQAQATLQRLQSEYKNSPFLEKIPF
ncbi:MAG: outer membrane protein assembly factor BamD [Nitrospirota bacterium]